MNPKKSRSQRRSTYKRGISPLKNRNIRISRAQSARKKKRQQLVSSHRTLKNYNIAERKSPKSQRALQQQLKLHSKQQYSEIKLPSSMAKHINSSKIQQYQNGNVCYPRTDINKFIPEFNAYPGDIFSNFLIKNGIKGGIDYINQLITDAKKEALNTSFQQGTFKVIIPISNGAILKIIKPSFFKQARQKPKAYKEIMRSAKTEYQLQTFLKKHGTPFIKERIAEISDIFFVSLKKEKDPPPQEKNPFISRTTLVTIEENLHAKGVQEELFTLITSDNLLLQMDDAAYIYMDGMKFLTDLHIKHHIVHRDIKPENLFFNLQSKKVTFFDFGFACSNTCAKCVKHKCEEYMENCGPLVGTLNYIPKEMTDLNNWDYVFTFDDYVCHDIYSLIRTVLYVLFVCMEKSGLIKPEKDVIYWWDIESSKHPISTYQLLGTVLDQLDDKSKNYTPNNLLLLNSIVDTLKSLYNHFEKVHKPMKAKYFQKVNKVREQQTKKREIIQTQRKRNAGYLQTWFPDTMIGNIFKK